MCYQSYFNFKILLHRWRIKRIIFEKPLSKESHSGCSLQGNQVVNKRWNKTIRQKTKIKYFFLLPKHKEESNENRCHPYNISNKFQIHGWICLLGNPAASGSNPKHNIYAFSFCNWIVMWKGRKWTKRGRVLPLQSILQNTNKHVCVWRPVPQKVLSGLVWIMRDLKESQTCFLEILKSLKLAIHHFLILFAF